MKNFDRRLIIQRNNAFEKIMWCSSWWRVLIDLITNQLKNYDDDDEKHFLMMTIMIMMMIIMMMMNGVVSERSSGYHCLRRDLNEHSARNKEQDNGGDDVGRRMRMMKMRRSRMRSMMLMRILTPIPIMKWLTRKVNNVLEGQARKKVPCIKTTLCPFWPGKAEIVLNNLRPPTPPKIANDHLFLKE